MQNAIPCLRADAAVRPFDAADGDCRFVVAIDDRHFLVSAAVAAVLEESRESRTLAAIAEGASLRLGITVSPRQVAQVLREQAPQILFESPSEARALTAPLRFRHIIAGAHTLRPVLRFVARLFTQRWAVLFAVLFLVVESMVAARALTAQSHTAGVGQVTTAAMLTVFGVLVHELGHLAACLRHQAPHGGIGIGLYWCVPVFFAEVHGAWLLARHQRAVVDAGGLYLQSIYVALLGATYLVSGAPSILAAIVCSHFLMLHTLNPVLKYDGYWLLSDLTRTHNLHDNVRKIAAAMWRALCLRHSGALPTASDLALLGGFAVAGLAYFAYTISLLGQSLASTSARTVELWAAVDQASASRTVLTALHAAGETVLLAALLVMAGGIAILLARSLIGIAREPSHDR